MIGFRVGLPVKKKIHLRLFLAQWTSHIFLALAALVMVGMAVQRAGNWQVVARRPSPSLSNGSVLFVRVMGLCTNIQILS